MLQGSFLSSVYPAKASVDPFAEQDGDATVQLEPVLTRRGTPNERGIVTQVVYRPVVGFSEEHDGLMKRSVELVKVFTRTRDAQNN
jgi:hypothetical protein